MSNQRQQSSTAYPMTFLMVQSSDHITGITGLISGSTLTATISKNGGAFGTLAGGSGAITEIGNGWYSMAGNATDRNTLGEFLIHCTGSGADPSDTPYEITAQDPFAAQWSANITQVIGNAATAATAGILDVNAKNIGNHVVVLDANNLLEVCATDWAGGVIPSPNVTGVPLIDLKYSLGTISPAAAGSVSVDWAHVVNPTTTLGLTGTTISSGQVVQTVSGSVGGIVGITFPSNFGLLGITAGGKISEVVLTDTLTTYTGNTLQTGDSFARIGATGSGLTSLAPAATALSTAQWTPTRAGYLDNLSGGAVALASGVNVMDWGGVVVGTIPPDSVFIRSATAQAGTASTITLDSGASATNNLYQNQVVTIIGGTGIHQSALIASYVGSTKVATINGTWATNPDATSVFVLSAFGSISASVSGNVTVGGYAGGQDPGTYVLATPSHKLATDVSGSVTYNNAAPPTAAAIAAVILSNPAHLLTVDASGEVAANNLASLLDVALSGHTTAGTAGAALGNLINALSESYAANGSPATQAQLLYMIWSVLANIKQPSGGTLLNALKLDGSTAAMTLTLDSGSDPTQRLRTA